MTTNSILDQDFTPWLQMEQEKREIERDWVQRYYEQNLGKHMKRSLDDTRSDEDRKVVTEG